MTNVVILVEPEVSDHKRFTGLPPILERMLSAFKQAMMDCPPEPRKSVRVQVMSIAEWATPEAPLLLENDASDQILCPFTLNLPTNLNFQHLPLFQACKDVAGLRQRVAQELEIPVGSGQSWLPVVYTARGPLYSEVIGSSDEQLFQGDSLENVSPFDFYQPLHLSDQERQPLYQMAYRLLDWLKVPPAVYLMQFGFRDEMFQFDRLWPFPAVPAIASLGVQMPNLFACHWLCLTAQPIQDLVITGNPLLGGGFNPLEN